MIVRVKFKCEKLELPIHYNDVVQGFVYSNISNNDFREFLHEKGFQYEKRTYKLFTFSRISGKFSIDRERKKIVFLDEFTITFCSLVDDFINDFIKNCMFSDNLQLDWQKVKVISVETEETGDLEKTIRVKALSPIVTYTTVNIEGRKRTIYHMPDEVIFQTHIRNNLIKKAKSIGENLENDDFSIKLIGDFKENIVYFRKTLIKGYAGIFEISGSKRLKEIALNCGIGSKNSQGFGCIKKID